MFWYDFEQSLDINGRLLHGLAPWTLHWPLENFTVYVGDPNVSVVEKGEQKFRIVESFVHERFR